MLERKLTAGSLRRDTAELSVLFASVLFVFLLLSCSGQKEYAEPPVKGTDVAISAAGLENGSPQFFTMHYKGRKINFFVVRAGGKIMAFLDACARCYPKKLGYTFENGHFVCRACGLNYSASDMEKGFGSCFPIRLDGRLRDGQYIIPLSVLQKSADKF